MKTAAFWKYYLDLDRQKVVRAVYRRFLETGRFDALSCQWQDGEENKPHIFWDSDVAKWIEGAAKGDGASTGKRTTAAQNSEPVLSPTSPLQTATNRI